MRRTPRLLIPPIAALLVLACATSPMRAKNGGLTIPGLNGPKPADPTASPATQPAATNGLPSIDDVKTEQAKVKEELAAAQTAAAAIQQDTDAPSTGTFRAEQVQLLTRLDSIIAQTIAALTRTTDLEAQRDTLKNGDLASLRTEGAKAVVVPEGMGRSEQRGSVSFLFLEQLRNDLTTQEQGKQSAAASLASVKASLTSAQDALDKAEVARRAAREAAETNSDPTKTAQLTTARELAALRARVERANVTLRRAEEQAANAALTLAEAQLEAAELRIEFIRPEVRFTSNNDPDNPGDLQVRIADLDKISKAADERLDAIRTRRFPPPELSVAQRELSQLDPNNAEPLARARFEAAAERIATLEREAKSLEDRKARIAVRKELWTDRYDVWTGALEDDALRTVLEEAQAHLANFESQRTELIRDLSQFRQQIASIQDRIQSLPADQQELAAALNAQKDAIDRRVNVLADELTQIELAKRTGSRLVEEIEDESEHLTAREIAGLVRDFVVKSWNTALFPVGDTNITIGKIVLGVALLVFGLIAIRRIARLLGRRVFPKFGLNESASSALQAIVYYILLVTVILAALSIVKVPLTAFAFLGGAIAIGIGFGSQQIANNFISGLILMAERPIRVGDFIEVGDITGTVNRIGARATVVRTGSNTELIVPNSKFLENDVINWTLSDQEICRWFDVGVAYGSNLRDVVAMLKKAADDHGRVLKTPPPQVLLKDFGDNAIIFTLVVTFRMNRPFDRLLIPSDLRMRIDNLFSTAGIVIAFPQRDVHLDTSAPIDIRMLAPDGAEPKTDAPSQAAPASDRASGGA